MSHRAPPPHPGTGYFANVGGAGRFFTRVTIWAAVPCILAYAAMTLTNVSSGDTKTKLEEDLKKNNPIRYKQLQEMKKAQMEVIFGSSNPASPSPSNSPSTPPPTKK